jgi:uncharacterized protein (DUF2384 family)
MAISPAIKVAELPPSGGMEPSAKTVQEMSNYKKLIERVVDVFGDEIKASLWLSVPSADFEGQTPLQVAKKNGYSVDLLEPALIRIEHGIYT